MLEVIAGNKRNITTIWRRGISLVHDVRKQQRRRRSDTYIYEYNQIAEMELDVAVGRKA